MSQNKTPEEIEQEIIQLNSKIFGLYYYLGQAEIVQKIAGPGTIFNKHFTEWNDLMNSRYVPPLEQKPDPAKILERLRDILSEMKDIVVAAGVPPEDITDQKLKGYREIRESEMRTPAQNILRELSKKRSKEDGKGPKIH